MAAIGGLIAGAVSELEKDGSYSYPADNVIALNPTVGVSVGLERDLQAAREKLRKLLLEKEELENLKQMFQAAEGEIDEIALKLNVIANIWKFVCNILAFSAILFLLTYLIVLVRRRQP